MRHSSRTTYMAAAIIFMCILYWISVTTPDSTMSLHDFSHLSYQHSADQSTGADLAKDGDKKSKSKSKDDSEKPAAKATKADADSRYPAKFPRQVWQTANDEGKTKYADKSLTWSTLKAFEYNFLNDEEATKYVHQHFKSNPSIVRFWDSLTAAVLKADFLRYLIMLSSGGVYSDIDTTCLAHPDTWIPLKYGASEINAIIGIEYDDTTYKMFVRPISFCQWTLMAKPNHPIFQYAVQRVMSNLEFLARKQKVELSQLTLGKLDVLEATGPGMITDVVMQVLRDKKQWVDWSTFHDLKEPKLFGDVLILPINGFAASQKHSHAGDPAYGESLVAHHFGRTWYKRPDGSDKMVMSPEEEEKEKQKDKLTSELKEVMDHVKEKQKDNVVLYKEGSTDDGKLRVPIPAAALQKAAPNKEKAGNDAEAGEWVEYPDGESTNQKPKVDDKKAAYDSIGSQKTTSDTTTGDKAKAKPKEKQAPVAVAADSDDSADTPAAKPKDASDGTVDDMDDDPTVNRKTKNPDPFIAADLDGESASMKTKASDPGSQAGSQLDPADAAKDNIQKTSVSMSGKPVEDPKKKEKDEDSDEFGPRDMAALVKAADDAKKVKTAKDQPEAKEKMAGPRVHDS